MKEHNPNEQNSFTSKGIEFYCFLEEGFSIKVLKFNTDGSHKEYHYSSKTIWQYDSFQIEKDFMVFDNIGFFLITVEKNGKPLLDENGEEICQHFEINVITGKFSNITGTFLPKISKENDFCVNMGLYESFGAFNPKSHQISISITKNMSDWQNQLFNQYSSKFHRNDLIVKNLFLPGSHDCGMYVTGFKAIDNLAKTQYDSIRKQLELGARYFDFRPGLVNSEKAINLVKSKYIDDYVNRQPWGVLLPTKLINQAKELVIDALKILCKNELQHVHALIPGETYLNFLNDIFSFLADDGNHSEIVVLEICSNGIMNENGAVHIATKKEIEDGLMIMKQKYKVNYGGEDLLESKVQDLINANKRVIILDRIHTDPPITGKGSYYSGYESDDPFVPAKSFDSRMNPFKNIVDYLYLACQITSTATTNGLESGIAGCTPLTATKAKTDFITTKYLLYDNLNYHQNNMIFLAGNDFYDNAFTSTALNVNKLKLNIYDKFDTYKAKELITGEPLMRGDFITSENGKYRLKYDENGQVILSNRLGITFWVSDSKGLGGDRLQLIEEKGDLVITDKNDQIYWSLRGFVPNYKGYKDSRLKIQNDGILIIESMDKKLVWKTEKYDKDIPWIN